MSQYTNQISISINEVARLTFLDATKNIEVAEVVMHIGMLTNFYELLGKTIRDHEENLVKQIEANKGLN